MEKEFWLNRWQKQEIGFHLSETNPYLITHWPQLTIQFGATVLVPMCGKSLDLLWLRDKGYQVIGVELSDLAIQAFLSENNLSATREETHYGSRYQTTGITLYCADFFDLPNSLFQNVSAIFDRAALIALPDNLRLNYVNKLKEALPNKVQTLLVCFEYPQEQMPGPPFSVTESQVHAYFSGNKHIKLLEKINILMQEPRFQARGLTTLHESIYLLY